MSSFLRRFPFAFLGLVVVAAVAYSNSFHGPFILDDIPAIQANAHVRHLWPPSAALTAPHETTVAGRPIVCLTLALNYAATALGVWSYHAINLLIHIAAGCVLFAILRRTFLSAPLRDRFGSHAVALALAVSAIWIVHPLNTMCVTYVIQRAESLMALCYLLALYCVIRSDDTPRRALWQIAAVLSCLAGIGAKEVAASAPIIILVYDATFLAGTYREALRRRGLMYAALALCWIPLALLIALGSRSESTGMSISGLSPWDYFKTQPEIILHYLKLVFWPSPLCFDYNWPIASASAEILIPGLILLVALIATCWGIVRRRPWAFLGLWFFAILAPSSSFLPIIIVASEHRMYLSSVAVITAAVLLIWSAAQRFASPLSPWLGRSLLLVALAIVVLFGALTFRRNVDYQSPLGLWRQVTELRPENPRAWTSVGALLGEAGQTHEAIAVLKRAIASSPDYADAHFALAAVLAQSARFDQAVDELNATLRLRPHDKKAECILGSVLADQGKYPEAVAHLKAAVERAPDFAIAHGKLGITLTLAGQNRAAVDELRTAVALQPDLAAELNSLAWILATDPDPTLRNPPEAVAAAERANKLSSSGDPQILDTLAAAYASAGRFVDALAAAQQALATADRTHQPETAPPIRERIELYRQGRPYLSLPSH
jgi:protein O-mannosyl-transferase